MGVQPAPEVRLELLKKTASTKAASNSTASRLGKILGKGSPFMRLAHFRNTVANVFRDVNENHIMAFAAALSYYFILSVFPLLILVSVVVAYLPISGLFDQILGMLTSIVPADSLSMFKKILGQILLSRHAGLLTFGIVFTIWSSSSGFAAMIEALNVTYHVPETRPIWKTRALAIGLTFLVGLLLAIALGVLIVGPKFGGWLAEKMGLSPAFVAIWPYIRWSVAAGFTVIAVELLYFWGPNVRQKFLRTLPGAVIAVGGWIGLSHLLSLYFRHFANYSATYGTLGAPIAFAVWLYWTNFVMLIGADVNASLLRETGEANLLLKDRRRKMTPKHQETDLAA